MTLVMLVVLGQLADGLAYQLVVGKGTELGPLGVLDPLTVLAVKVASAIVLGVGAFALRHRSRLLAWVATVGFIGAWTEVAAL